MKLNNYNLDGHALSILNKKIDEQHSEIIHLISRIIELEKDQYNFSFYNFPEIVPVDHQGKLLHIVASVNMYKNLNTPGHHVITEFKSKNDQLRSYSYQVSEDLLNSLDDYYLSARLIEMHKILINTIIDDLRKIKGN